MRDSMQEMFDTLLVGEPPMRLTAGQVRGSGRTGAGRWWPPVLPPPWECSGPPRWASFPAQVM
jgi:hypothetical protein